MEITHELVLGQSLQISPRLIQANHMLGLSSLELQQFIQQETYENPALEATEQTICPACGTILIEMVCHACLAPSKMEDREPSDSSEAYFEAPLWDRGTTGGREEEFDLLSRVAAGMTLGELLLMDLKALLTDPRDVPVAEFLVGSLDHNGWLRCSVAEVVTALGVEETRVQRILALLQSLEPVGIAARDLRECLLIQLTHLESEGQDQRYVRAIITDHFEELARHKYRHIARALGATLDDVIAACHFVRDRLNPFPAQQERGRSRMAPAELPRYMLPDVIIKTDADGALAVTVVESKRFTLRISPYYQQIWHEVEARGSQVMEKDREHVRQYVGRARRFLANLEQRRQTMQKIGEFVADYQTDFLLHGVRHLRPLTRAMVAASTGMHESTVSRATAGKYVMIPNGRVIPFGDFFTASLNVKDVIKGMIQQESAPLDDQEIATRLHDHGHYIARRTVAKYRDELGILPSALRR